MEAMFQLRVNNVTVVKKISQMSVVNKYSKAPGSGEAREVHLSSHVAASLLFHPVKYGLNIQITVVGIDLKKKKEKITVMRSYFLQNLEFGHFSLLVSLRWLPRVLRPRASWALVWREILNPSEVHAKNTNKDGFPFP